MRSTLPDLCTMLAFTPCSRSTRATDAPGCIAFSTTLRFSAILRRCRLPYSIFTAAEPFITTSSTTTLRVMISPT